MSGTLFIGLDFLVRHLKKIGGQIPKFDSENFKCKQACSRLYEYITSIKNCECKQKTETI